MTEEMENVIDVRLQIREKLQRELAERTPEEKEKDEKFLAEFYTWKKE